MGRPHEARARPAAISGKLPARADFVTGRLTHDTVACWDGWLQQALAVSQAAIGTAWRSVFFAAPIWRFILPEGACGGHALLGIVMPSVDSVGRCFPLMLAQEIEGGADPVGLMAGSARWFAALEALALEALGERAEPSLFDRELPPCGFAVPPRGAVSGSGAAMAAHDGEVGTWAALPLASAAPVLLRSLFAPATRQEAGIWWTTGASHLPPGLAVSRGLVPCHGFPALLDGFWARHGWAVSPTGPERNTASTGAADWDR